MTLNRQTSEKQQLHEVILKNGKSVYVYATNKLEAYNTACDSRVGTIEEIRVHFIPDK